MLGLCFSLQFFSYSVFQGLGPRQVAPLLLSDPQVEVQHVSENGDGDSISWFDDSELDPSVSASGYTVAGAWASLGQKARSVQ